MAVEAFVARRLEGKAILPPPSEKLLSQDDAKEFVKAAHARGKTVILVEGTWDF